MPSPQAQIGLQTAPNMALWCQHVLLAVAAFGTTACITTAIVTAADAVAVIDAADALAVIDAADVANMGCNNHHAVPYSMCEHCASSKCKPVMVKVSMPFREVTRGSDLMKAIQGNRPSTV